MDGPFALGSSVLLHYLTSRGTYRCQAALVKERTPDQLLLVPCPQTGDRLAVSPGSRLSLSQWVSKTRYCAGVRALAGGGELALTVTVPHHIQETIRRSHPRVTTHLLYRAESGISGQVQNLSESGALFLAPRGSYAPGHPLRLTIYLPQRPISLRARVVRVKSQLRQDAVGARFVELHVFYQKALSAYIRHQQWALAEQLGRALDPPGEEPR